MQRGTRVVEHVHVRDTRARGTLKLIIIFLYTRTFLVQCGTVRTYVPVHVRAQRALPTVGSSAIITMQHTDVHVCVAVLNCPPDGTLNSWRWHWARAWLVAYGLLK